MAIPPEFRRSLIQSIKNAFNEFSFQDLTNNYPIGIVYEETRPPGANFPISLGIYVDEVKRRGNISELLEAILEERKDNDEIISVYNQYQNFYEKQNNQIKLKQELFIRGVLKSQSNLFIGRDIFSSGLSRMINSDTVSLLGLKGQSKSGLSYVRWYLSEIEEDLNCFKFLNLRLTDVGDKYPGETVTAGHLAEVISARLKMSFAGIKDFKLGPFVSSLEARLDELAEKDERWLFFIDQFDYPHTPDVKILVKNLGKRVLQHSNKFYLIFSIYENWEEEWGSDEIDMTEMVEFQSFTQLDIQSYLENLYTVLDKIYTNQNMDFKSKISKATFFLTAHNRLSAQIYDTTKGPNVADISKELKIWFRHLKQNLQL